MTLNRRSLIGLSVAGVATIAGGKRLAVAASQSLDEIGENALVFFKQQGHTELPALGMITGHAFNGGLRFDDTRPEPLTSSWVSLQPAARIEDIGERERPGVLANFHILGLQTGPSPEPGTMFDRVMDFLVNQRGLDPTRMLFVSTEAFRPIHDRRGDIAAGQFHERSRVEAEAASDGSGVFAPQGHPYGPRFWSVGIYYPLPDTPPPRELSYPPERYIEIADVGITPDEGEPGSPEPAGIGLERVAIAEGKPIPDFEESRLNLLRIIEDEARREGKPLPPGYAMFASL